MLSNRFGDNVVDCALLCVCGLRARNAGNYQATRSARPSNLNIILADTRAIVFASTLYSSTNLNLVVRSRNVCMYRARTYNPPHTFSVAHVEQDEKKKKVVPLISTVAR